MNSINLTDILCVKDKQEDLNFVVFLSVSNLIECFMKTMWRNPLLSYSHTYRTHLCLQNSSFMSNG